MSGPLAPLAFWIFLIVATGAGMIGISALLGPRLRRKQKLDTYECGVPLMAGSRDRFPVKFYLVAILFILFDIETVFLIPWSVVYKGLGMAGFVEMLVFIGVLGFGLWYIWKRGALEWE